MPCILHGFSIVKASLGFILYIFVLISQAADYHVCSNGSDSNDGLSHAAAWKSYSKAHSVFSTLAAGDSILFCKGEEFSASGGGQWDNRNSTRTNPVTLGSYTPPGGAGDLPNPVIFGNGMTFSNGGNAEHKEGFVVRDLALRGSNFNGYGIFIYNDTDFVSIINVEVYNFDIGIHAGGSNSPNPGSDGRNSDLTILGSYIHDNKTQGFIGGGNNLLIENSVFVNNGWNKAKVNHNIYLSSSGQNSNAIIRGNWLYQSAMFGGKCNGVSLVVHGFITNLLIENNVIWEDPDAVDASCWGIAVDNGYGGSVAEGFAGLVIRHNTIANTGNLGIGCAVCQDVIIENNTILHQVSFGSTVIRVPNRNENRYPRLPASNNVTVRNNTILYDGAGIGVGISLGDGDGSRYKSTGNRIFYRSGSGMVEGCEIYNDKDFVAVAHNTCEKGIPKSLIDFIKAKTIAPVFQGSN